jgi:hypothetical protein
VFFAGSGNDPDGSINAYSWSFPGGVPPSSSMATPGNVSYLIPGSSVASLTVTDNAGAPSTAATRTVTVTDFALSATPASRSVSPGGSTTYAATITAIAGFTGTVNFAVSGLPSGVTGSFSPGSLNTSGSTTLNVATSASTPAGSYPLTLTGTSGPVTHSVNVTLVIAGDFSLSVTPASQTVPPNGNTTYTVTVTGQAFTGIVNLSVSGLAKPATAKLTPSSVTNAGTSTLAIDTKKNMTRGTYTLTVTGTSGGQVRSANVTLVVQ